MKIQNEYKKEAETDFSDENLSPEELRLEISRLHKELEAERAQKYFLLSAIESLPNPIFVKDDQAKFVFFNKNYGDFFGMDREEFIGSGVLELPFLPPTDRERYQKEDLKLINNSSSLHYEVDFTTAAGEQRPSFYWSCGFETPQTGEKGLVGEIVNISKERDLEAQLKCNIEQLEKANATIAAASKMDGLTGVYNRLFLDEQANSFIPSVLQNETSICFLMLDLDRFKSVNDNFGHLAGDDVLKNFAKILKASCRGNDFPIRYGGEEFLVLLHDVDLSDAKKIAERIREKTARELLLPDGNTITVSIGVSQYRQNESLNTCLSRADKALYQAKNTGRNKVVTSE